MANRTLRDFVRQRANARCEYCHLPDDAEPFFTYHVDRVVPGKHGGTYEPENCCWTCPGCNLRHGTNLSGIDPDTNEITVLFSPRNDDWSEHFKWDGTLLIGETPVGRATIRVFVLKDPDNIEQREMLTVKGRFPFDR